MGKVPERSEVSSTHGYVCRGPLISPVGFKVISWRTLIPPSVPSVRSLLCIDIFRISRRVVESIIYVEGPSLGSREVN